jgi:hypothetical protein
MVWLRDFLYNPRELERLYGEIHLLTSLRHRAGFAHVAPPFSDFFCFLQFVIRDVLAATRFDCNARCNF